MFRNFVFTLALIISLNGCRGVTPALVVETTAKYTDISVTLDEADVRALVASTVTTEPPWLINPQVQFQGGSVILRGRVRESNSGQYVPSVATVQLRASDGWLICTVTAVQVGGWVADANALASINQSIGDGLRKAQAENRDKLSLQSLSLTDSALQFRLRATGATPSSATIQVTSDEAFYYATVAISEAELAAWLAPFFNAGEQPWLQAPTVSLRKGELLISGQVRQQDGKLVPASISLGFTVVANKLVVAVNSFTWDTFVVPADWLANLNRGIEKNVAASQSANSTLQTIQIDAGRITVTLKIPR